MTRITRLLLSENPITARGLKVLAEAIMKCPNFEGITIGNVKNPSIATERIKDLLFTLKNHPTFRYLAINDKDHNELNDTIETVNEERLKLGRRRINVISRFQQKQTWSN